MERQDSGSSVGGFPFDTQTAVSAVVLAVGLAAASNVVCKRRRRAAKPPKGATPAQSNPTPAAGHPQHKPGREDRQDLLASVRPLSSPDKGFTIGSYNLLNKHFHTRWYSDYCTTRNKSWEHRMKLFKQTIPQMNFDVLAVQEANVGSFGEDFAFVGDHGYSIVAPYDKLLDKDPAKANRLAKTALLYKSNEFELKWSDNRSRTLLCGLKHRSTGQLLYIINCHLEGNPVKVQDRFTQLKSAFKIMQRNQKKDGIDPVEANLVVCGDFNCARECSPYALLSTGSLAAGFVDPWNADEVVTTQDYSVPYSLQDTYRALRQPDRPTFCANKRSSLIDFVFASSSMQVHANREVHTAEQWDHAKEMGVPCDWHPSDHFAIGSALTFGS